MNFNQFLEYYLCETHFSMGRPANVGHNWARLAFLVAGNGRGECFYFFCFFLFIPVPFSFLSLSLISSYYLFYLFSPCLLEKTQNDTQGLKCRLTPTQSITIIIIIIIIVCLLLIWLYLLILNFQFHCSVCLSLV